MDIHAAVGWYLEQRRRQYLTVGSHHDNVRLCGSNCVDEVRVTAFLRLPHGQTTPDRQLFDWGRPEFELSALWAVRLGDDAEDTER